MTKQLYLEDSYMREFDAVVIASSETAVELDQSCFYPESGGQPCDTGWLVKDGEEYNVINVKKDAGRIIHLLDRAGLKPGDKVRGRIDWDRRHLFMRYHTACHILSAIINNVTGAEITGNQIGADKTRIDFSIKDFDREKFGDFVTAANKLIAAGKPVHIRHMPREEAFQIPSLFKLRKLLPESIRVLRIVEIEGFDMQPCAGTHVRNTAEIGSIDVLEFKNKGTDNRRVYFRLNPPKAQG